VTTSPKRIGRPPQNDSADTRDRILRAAQQSFARKGYEAATNNEIAATVGITAGAIYHYFDSKADLYAAVYAELQERVQARFEKAVAPLDCFVEQVVAMLEAAADLAQDDPSIAAFVVNAAAEADRHADLAERLAPLMDARQDVVRRMADDAAARGEIAAKDTEAVTDMVSAVLSGIARHSTLTRSADRNREAMDALQRLFRGCLVSPAQEPSGRQPRGPGTRAPR
jgi:AcrR family transcriptional regulator